MDQWDDLIWKFGMLLFRIDGLYDQWARSVGETGNTLSLFYALCSGKPYTQKRISEEFLIPKQTLNSIVKDYTAKGYIRLESSQENHREKYLCLTDEGKKFSEPFLSELSRIERAAVEAMTQEYGDAVIKGLEKFCDVFQKMMQTEQPDTKAKQENRKDGNDE